MSSQTIEIGPDFCIKIPFKMDVSKDPHQDMFWYIERKNEEGKHCLIDSNIKVFKTEKDVDHIFLKIMASKRKNIEKECTVILGNVDYTKEVPQKCLTEFEDSELNIIKMVINEEAYSTYFKENEEQISSDSCSD